MKYIFVSFMLLVTAGSSAQITTGKVRWKSGSNFYYTYIGELRDGKPHGWGYAITQEAGLWIQVFGEFKNGMIDGSTVIRHSTGKIVIAKWKENKPEGAGIVVTQRKDIEYGNFVNGIMQGKTTKVYADNSIAIDNIKNGLSNGRVIFVNSYGNMLWDIIYVNDSANGPGYQYETEKKYLLQGIWKNDKWVMASTNNYPSFMRNPGFGSTTTANSIVIYSELVEKEGRKVQHDTCYAYDLRNNNRWFGYFDRGEFKRGVRLIGDSIRTIGQLDNGNKQGFCIEYKKDRYLYAGNYNNGYMEGQGITVDIDDSTIYDGYLSGNSYSGRAVLLRKNKEIKIGNFSNGNLHGEGKTIFPDGRSVSGKYENGKLSLTGIKEVIKPDGKKLI